MITRTRRGELQRTLAASTIEVARLRRELADTITAAAADAARQETAITEALETARYDIVKGLKAALGCGHNPPQVRCVRCKSLAKAITVVDAAVAAAGGTAPAEDETA
jgi:hypothetical protein